MVAIKDFRIDGKKPSHKQIKELLDLLRDAMNYQEPPLSEKEKRWKRILNDNKHN